MSIISFKIQEVKKLVDELKAAPAYSASTDDLFNPVMYPDGVPRDEHGRSEQEAEKELQVALSESVERTKLTRTQRLIQSWNDYP